MPEAINYPTGPASLFSIIARPEEECCCFQYEGDNPKCRVHVLFVEKKDGTVVRGMRVNIATQEEDDAD